MARAACFGSNWTGTDDVGFADALIAKGIVSYNPDSRGFEVSIPSMVTWAEEYGRVP